MPDENINTDKATLKAKRTRTPKPKKTVNTKKKVVIATSKASVTQIGSHYLPVIAEKASNDTEDKPPVYFFIASVKAKSKNGFWRVARHWTYDTKKVLVLDALDNLEAVSQQLSDMSVFDEIITLAQFNQLDAEPLLITTIDTKG